MSHLSRRQFALAAGAALGLAPFLAACETPVHAAECASYDTLTPDELQSRQALAYVDETPQPAKRCDNCRFYRRPTGGSACGGCELFAGPVAPGGYCTAWASMA